MKAVPAVLRLTDFSQEFKDRPSEPEVCRAVDDVHQPSAAEHPTAQEYETAIGDARRTALAEAEASYSQQLHQARQEFEERLEVARSQLIEQQAKLLAARISEQFEALSHDLAERLFEHCRPLLGVLARERAITELVEVTKHVIQSNCEVQISGPAQLLTALRAGLADQNLNATWREEEESDVSIGVGDTIIETRLSDWLRGEVKTVDD